MPKLEPKQIQKELDQGQIWPVYWIYGQERMKSRELVKRIRKAVQGDETQSFSLGGLGLSDQTLDGSEISGAEITDSAQSMTLGGGTRFIIVRDAHEMDEAESITQLFAERGPKDQLAWVCVFLSKDLDMRKKLSKQLIESAAVVPCEEVPENDRQAWIQYLAKLRGMALSDKNTAQLCLQEPWSLDIIDSELEKLSLAGEEDGLLTEGIRGETGTERFTEALMMRDSQGAIRTLESFAENPDESLPLVGLLSWNVRQLVQFLTADAGSKSKVNPYIAERLKRWAGKWEMNSLSKLQEMLLELDFGSKQTPKTALGLWTDLVIEVCAK